MAEKTCISLLQEYCQQNKHQPPSYKELPPEKGSGNSTTFTCKVQISVSKEKFEATGTGLTKKAAKQKAASDLCEKLGINQSEVTQDSGFNETLCSSMCDLSLATPEKTPVSLLQEYCAKNFINAPYYEEAQDGAKSFKCKAALRFQGVHKEASGSGSSKKIAKHVAARSLLDELGIKYDWAQEVEKDTISNLQFLCASHGYCAPIYEDVGHTGPSHCPEFTMRCTLGTVEREAKAPSKKVAKQKVAKDILQYIETAPKDALQKLVIKPSIDYHIAEEVVTNKVIDRVYRQYRDSSNKSLDDCQFGDRHEFFVKRLEAIRLNNARREFISANKHASLHEKVEKTLKAAGLAYKVQAIPSMETQILQFELVNVNKDSLVMAFEGELWKRVADYLIVMLSIPITLSETMETLL